MRIRVLTSCTGKKKFSPQGQLNREDFQSLGTITFEAREETLAEWQCNAEEMYTGDQHRLLMEGVHHLRDSQGAGVLDLWILSAGYGLIPGDHPIVPYECTFQGMKVVESRVWSEHLGIQGVARQFFAVPADLTLVLLGDDYLRALVLDGSVQFAAPTVFFASKASRKHIRGVGDIRVVELEVADTRRFRAGLVGLKGEVAKRLLSRITTEGVPFIRNVVESSDVLSLVECV